MPSVLIKWNVGAFFTTVGCTLVPSSLLTVSHSDTTGKQKDRLPLQRYGGGSQVSELSSFFLVLALYLNDLFSPGNVHGNLLSVGCSSCYRISLSSTVSAMNKIIDFTLLFILLTGK